jgi:hypothetical protein
MNVMFDLMVFGIPLFLMHVIGVVNTKAFYKLSSALINWTTPIVYGMPMVLSGTKIHIDNIDVLVTSKSQDSLLLANHGSRIDWMVGMFIGHLTSLGNRPANRCRVGFVCEALIQLMPLIGWYRKLVCNDIFVWRSMNRDETTIRKNIAEIQRSGEPRMLILSPEGVVVDYGAKDMDYVHECRRFCTTYGVKPFEYVLTPRHKGTTCLLDQINEGGPFVSGCLVFVREGQLLNCKLLSPERVIPDIYDLNQGIAGKPISIYVHLRLMDPKNGHDFDAKAQLMEEYAWKDSILEQWDKHLQNGLPIGWLSQFTTVKMNQLENFLSHLYHIIAMISFALVFDVLNIMKKTFLGIFICVACTHTIGWLANESSMESVPFETGIKAFITFLVSMQKQRNDCKKKTC